jgi:hypothetical protein
VKSRSRSEQLPVRRIPVHELFPQPDEGRRIPPLPPSHHHRVRPPAPQGRRARSAPRGNSFWAIIFFATIIGVFGLIAYLRRDVGQIPYVLLEIRALEESGHPVTAADVLVNNKKMGVTDSFGEWRRYLQLGAGEEIEIDLKKKDQLIGSKSVAIPKRQGERQDVELQVAIAMKRVYSLSKTSTPPATNLANTKPGSRPGEQMSEENWAKDKHVRTEAPAAGDTLDDELSATGDTGLGIYFDDGLNSVQVMSSIDQPKPANVMDRHQQSVVRERVLPVFINDLQNLGLKVERTASWKVSLGYVPNDDQVGYIRAEIEWLSPLGQVEKSSFIAGFAKTYDETGRALTSLLRLHMKKTYWASKENGLWVVDETAETRDFWKLKPGTILSDTSGERFPVVLSAESQGSRRFKLQVGKAQPCEAVRQRSRCAVSTESLKEAPPLPGWALKRVRILGPVPNNADVYVAGFQARAVGNNQWEFWSKGGSSLKALIVAGVKIAHSEAFKDVPGESVILKMAALPSKNKPR